MVMKNLKKPTNAKDLLTLGKDQGFVTQDDILNIYPEAKKHILEIEDLFEKLGKAGIDIFETFSQDEVTVKPVSELEKELEALAVIPIGEVSDPVRMYLREI